MSSRERTFSMVLTVITAATVVALLAYNIYQTNTLAEDRAAAALAVSKQNREVLKGVSNLLTDMSRTQAAQRRAFQAIARRNEVLHGNPPNAAPDFADAQSSNPPARVGVSGPDSDSESRRQQDRRDSDGAEDGERAQDTQEPREREPRRRRAVPRPEPSPEPSPSPGESELCLPTLKVCVP